MLTVCVEVFKTNVEDQRLAEEIRVYLREYFPQTRITFDLDDCDRILRMAGSEIDPCRVEELVNKLGHFCEALE